MTRQLENYLSDFGGCILLVSHDRALLDRLTDYLFIFDGEGGIKGFTGNYEEYREMRAEEIRRTRAEPGKQRQRPREKKPGLSFLERKECGRLFNEIAELEEEKRELESGFQRADQEPAQIGKNNKRYREIGSLLDAKMSRWEELAARAGPAL
jgi:ATP-binding cassette subfamily F protein uup